MIDAVGLQSPNMLTLFWFIMFLGLCRLVNVNITMIMKQFIYGQTLTLFVFVKTTFVFISSVVQVSIWASLCPCTLINPILLTHLVYNAGLLWNSRCWSKLCFCNDSGLWGCYWPFVRGIHQWLVDSPHKGPVMPSDSYMHLWTVLWKVHWKLKVIMMHSQGHLCGKCGTTSDATSDDRVGIMTSPFFQLLCNPDLLPVWC